MAEEGSRDDAIEITVVDVAHGNTTVLRDGDEVGMVDCSRNHAVYDELARTCTNRLKHLVVSHSDNDHMSGVLRLIARGVSVGIISANADSAKDSEVWKDFRAVVDEEVLAGRSFLSSIHYGSPLGISIGRINLEVLHPDASLVLHGPGRSAHEGLVDSNDCSAVLRVLVNGKPVALLAGDLTRYGLDRMLERGLPMGAPVLVFPHHGGRSGGGNDRLFAKEICEAVGPEVVVFSHGRHSGYGTPQPEVVRGVRDYGASVKVLCTQLAMECDNRALVPRPRHLALRPAAGRTNGACCAGTMIFKVSPSGDVELEPNFADHRGFVASSVGNALCARLSWPD